VAHRPTHNLFSPQHGISPPPSDKQLLRQAPSSATRPRPNASEPATLHFVLQEPGTSPAHIEAAAAAMNWLTRFLVATGLDRAKAESWIAE